MSSKIDELQGKLDETTKQALALKDQAKDGVFSGEQMQDAERLLGTVKDLTGQLRKAKGDERIIADLDALAAGAGDLGEVEGILSEEDLNSLTKRQPVRSRKSWGQQFTEAEPYKAFAKQFDGREVPASMHVDLPAVEMKAILTDSGVGAALLSPDERGLIDYGPYQRPLVLRDLISNGRTSSNSVRYARITGWTNAAAGVHEASTATGTGTSGGVKPQSDIQTTAFTATVVTIAHWFAASKQSLSDVPLLRTLIDQFGRYGLAEEEEDQIIGGTGVANDQLDGFRLASGIQTQAFSTTIADSIRKAITKVQVNGQANPNGVLMNPADAEAVDLAKDSQLRYFGNGPFGLGPNTLWGLPRVVSQAVPAQKAYVADFRTILFLVRMDPTVAITDSHSDYFVRNLIAILFEERAANLIFRPSAICEVTTS